MRCPVRIAADPDFPRPLSCPRLWQHVVCMLRTAGRRLGSCRHKISQSGLGAGHAALQRGTLVRLLVCPVKRRVESSA